MRSVSDRVIQGHGGVNNASLQTSEIMAAHSYNAQLEDAQSAILRFLHGFETMQQNVRFQDIASSQRSLAAEVGDTLTAATTILEQATPPADSEELHRALRQALVYLTNAEETFLRRSAGADFGSGFLASRGQQCQALEILYRQRAGLPLLDAFFRLADDRADEAPRSVDDPSDVGEVGLIHTPAAHPHNNFSLYVPERYEATQRWPLIIALHGGYGRGDEYIWTWLRAARSRGYVVLSPKSIGQTWSIMQPAIDSQSVMAILDQVCDRYAIDQARIYLTGLSDGATFSYLLGLEHNQRFAAVAPIAGVVSPMTDPMLRAGRGKDLPLYVIHGAKDAIFPVETVRSTNALLLSLGYKLKYTELPEWGHALTRV